MLEEVAVLWNDGPITYTLSSIPTKKNAIADQTRFLNVYA